MTRPMIERIIVLAAAASSGNGAGTVEMARKLNVSEKTVHRDWDFIRDRLLVDMRIVQGTDRRFRHVATDPTGVLPLVKTLVAIL